MSSHSQERGIVVFKPTGIIPANPLVKICFGQSFCEF